MQFARKNVPLLKTMNLFLHRKPLCLYYHSNMANVNNLTSFAASEHPNNW